jgi:hypothetical protein
MADEKPGDHHDDSVDKPRSRLRRATDAVRDSNGFTGPIKTIVSMGAISFVMFICWQMLSWQYQSAKEERANAFSAAAQEREVFNKTVESMRANNGRMFDSLNTANHNIAGLSNGVSELLGVVRTLREDVKSLNSQLTKVREAGLRTGPPPGDGDLADLLGLEPWLFNPYDGRCNPPPK